MKQSNIAWILGAAMIVLAFIFNGAVWKVYTTTASMFFLGVCLICKAIEQKGGE